MSLSEAQIEALIGLYDTIAQLPTAHQTPAVAYYHLDVIMQAIIVKLAGIWTPLYWTFFTADLLLLLVCAPILIMNRFTPRVHFRCGSLYVTGVFFVVAAKCLEAIVKTPSLTNWGNYAQLRFARVFFDMLFFPVYHAIFLRQYFLLSRPKIQQQLATIPVNDVAQYTALSRKLKRNKFLCTDTATWLIWGVHAAFLVLGASLAYARNWNPIADAVGYTQNGWVLYYVTVYIAEPLSAMVLCFAVIPLKSVDNFNIGPQLYLITALTAINLITGSVTQLIPSISTLSIAMDIAAWNSALLTFLISVLVLVIPSWPEKYLPGSLASSKSMGSMNNFDSPSGSQSNLSQTNSLTTMTPNQMPVSPPQKKKKGKKSELEDILATPAKLTQFKEFMAKEFCLENILFCVDMERYRGAIREIKEYSVRLKLAKHIAEEYVLPGAMNELNLVSGEVKIVKDKLKQCETESNENAIVLLTIFDHADDHVRELIEKNNLRRYHHLK